MFSGLEELPQLNKNLESLEKAIELLSTQLGQLHQDLEGLTREISVLRDDMGQK